LWLEGAFDDREGGGRDMMGRMRRRIGRGKG